MPIRLRFPLAGDPPKSEFQHAKGLQAVVLSWIQAADPTLAKMLHDENQPKPYTISPLWRQEGSLCFEVSLMTDWLLEAVAAGMESCDGAIRLGSQPFRVFRPEVLLTASWEELIGAPPVKDRYFDFHLLTPTAHHAPGPFRKSVVLPSPELYFGSWLNRWNLCCEHKIPDSLEQTLQERVAVASCSGGTRAVGIDPTRTFIGFKGNVRFKILKPDSLLEQDRMALRALSRFAPFCGTGVETVRGMGQTESLKGDG